MRDIIEYSKQIINELYEIKKSDPNFTKLKTEFNSLIENLEKKLDECGSLDMLSRFALIEILSQTITFHNDEYPESENPFALYLLGLFLNHNNLSAKYQENDFQEIYGLLVKIFEKNRFLIILKTPVDENRSISFNSQNKKFLDDNNPNVFSKQKKQYIQNIFRPFNEVFDKRFGFNLDDAYVFAAMIHSRFEILLKKHSKLVREKMAEGKELSKNSQDYKNFLKDIDCSFEEMESHLAPRFMMMGSSIVMTINFEKLCTILKYNQDEKICFKNYLNKFSCTFNDQFEDFKTPADENIIYYKPIIKLDEDTFFICRPEVLEERLEIPFDYLLLDDKIKKSELWIKYNKIKSSYIEDKIFQWLRKIFGRKNVFRNLFYWVGSDRREIDILVIYDNKILLFEAKSGFIPTIVKVGGKKMPNRLEDLIKKPYQQNLSAQNYILSNVKSQFWNENKSGKILTINNQKHDYEFFFINVTFEMLSAFNSDLKELIDLGYYQTNTLYPWSVYFFDFEVILDVLKDPIIFIHYIKARLALQEENIVQTIDELAYLGYYLIHGDLKIRERQGEYSDRLYLDTKYMNSLENHYTLNEKKPQLPISNNMKKQLKQLNKMKTQGFVDEGCYLLEEFFSYNS